MSMPKVLEQSLFLFPVQAVPKEVRQKNNQLDSNKLSQQQTASSQYELDAADSPPSSSPLLRCAGSPAGERMGDGRCDPGFIFSNKCSTN